MFVYMGKSTAHKHKPDRRAYRILATSSLFFPRSFHCFYSINPVLACLHYTMFMCACVCARWLSRKSLVLSSCSTIRMQFGRDAPTMISRFCCSFRLGFPSHTPESHTRTSAIHRSRLSSSFHTDITAAVASHQPTTALGSHAAWLSTM